MRKLITVAVAMSAACTVMVNGKPHRIGGGDSTPAASTSGPAAAAGSVAGNSTSAAIPSAMPDAEAIVIGKDFVGPKLTQQVSVKFDDIRTYDAGYKECDHGGGTFTTGQAPFSFQLEADLPELRVRLESQNGNAAGNGWIVIKPDGNYVCDDNHGEIYGKDWPRGQYRVLIHASSIGGGGALRFDVPTRVRAVVEAARGKLPTIALGAAGATNPLWTELKPTVSAEAADIGMDCGRGKHDRVMPIAKLDVTRASQWMVKVHDQSVFAVTPDEHCVELGSGEDQLAAGVHTLWMAVPYDSKTAASFVLEADDRARPLVFAAADKKPVADLAEPMTIAGTVRAAERQPSRSYSCRGPRAPDFYLTSDRPLQKVELSILWGRVAQRVHVFGPIEKADDNNIVRCGERGENESHGFDVFEGTYAVWVGTDDTAGVGSAYHVLLRRTDLPVEPLLALAPIPKDLSLEERALKHHYPYFSGGSLDDWREAFTRAPDQLFIYPRTTSRSGDDTVEAGEPLLVAWSDERGTTSAYRFDGSGVSIDTRLIGGERPDRVVLPATFAPPPIDRVDSAIGASGPEDRKAIDAYTKIDSRYSDCFGNYMAKNDPTWGHSGELYKISGSGRVTNVSDEVSKRANNKCGGDKVDAAAEKLIKALARTRAARYAAHLAAVRKRFGL